MKQPKTLEQEIREARDADRILNDPLFNAAFNSIESALIDKMRKVEIGNRDTQHELVLTLQLLGRLRAQFVETLQTGKMAEMQKTEARKAH